MESAAVTAHLVRVWQALQATKGKWQTSAEVAKSASVAPRTARAHLRRLVRLGLADEAEAFPAPRFKASGQAAKHNKAMLQKLKAAEEIFKP